VSAIAQFAVAAGVMAVLDGLWLSKLARSFYRHELGTSMRPKPDLVAAGAFYVVYVVAVVVLCVRSSDSVTVALGRGAMMGLAAYGTYDLTNRATLHHFSWRLAVVDMAWGTILSAVVAGVSFAVAG
jgi:uncharacterized membrane protein